MSWPLAAGRLVQIEDGNGQILSNRVVVDNPAGLAAALTAGSTPPRTDRPPELTSGDLDTPVGQALVWLHRHLVMDVSERVTSAPTGGVDAGEVGDQADDDLRERLEQQQLARDPRAGTYGRMWRHNTLEGTDPIIELLEALRYRLPTEPATSSARSLLANLLDRKLDRGPSEVMAGRCGDGGRRPVSESGPATCCAAGRLPRPTRGWSGSTRSPPPGTSA